jgi:hypothetical protein
MDRGDVLLGRLMSHLGGWFDTIRRGTGSHSVATTVTPSNGFKLRASWKTKAGAEEHFERAFTKEFVFGNSFTAGPNGWHVQRRTCQYAREFIGDVLKARGV